MERESRSRDVSALDIVQCLVTGRYSVSCLRKGVQVRCGGKGCFP